MLKKIKIQNFLSIENAEVNLMPLTVLIGANNSNNKAECKYWQNICPYCNHIQGYNYIHGHPGRTKYFLDMKLWKESFTPSTSE